MIQWKKFSEEKPEENKPIIVCADYCGYINAFEGGWKIFKNQPWTHWAYVTLPQEGREYTPEEE